MALRTPEEYRQSLRDGRVVYSHGEKVKDITRHPILKICLDLCSMDYVLAQDKRYRELFSQKNKDGELVPFVYVGARSVDDLLHRRQIIQTLSRTCFGLPGGAKFVGIDALNAVAVVCQRIDKKMGTHYGERLENFRQQLQKADPAIVGAMTDVKGDRSLRPSKQQPHQDYYVHIVDRRKDGIIVRGAKTHISYAPCANEAIVIPTRRMAEDDKDYAVAFAVPLNAKGVTMVASGGETIELADDYDYPLSGSLYAGDAIIVFNDVFIPNERVFMAGEWQLSGDMAYMFANFHRLSADAYKFAELEVMVGAALLMAEYNGLEKASHIQDKLAWLLMYAEGTEALGKSACQYCETDPDSGLVYPNPMYSNIAKFFFADGYHQALKYVQDIAGGAVTTIPHSKDFLNPETKSLMDKYFGGKAGVPTEHRVRAIKLVKDLSAAVQTVTSIHAEGSLAAQRLSIYTIADFERYKTAARRAARISTGKEHPAFAELPDFPPKY